jgi:hypothetical protein
MNPLDTHFNIALVRLSRTILEEVKRLHRAVKDQIHQVQACSAEILQSGPPLVRIGEGQDTTASITTDADSLKSIIRTYFALGRDILEVFDDPADVVGELGDAYRALMDSYVELAFELMALQDDLAELDEEPEMHAC